MHDCVSCKSICDVCCLERPSQQQESCFVFLIEESWRASLAFTVHCGGSVAQTCRRVFSGKMSIAVFL